ncbi:hypothetical protein IMG5_105950 [Ichthyophthirius multifiliis]|uniref:Uncharacterized protein n=1 Tax=Ichthyophthirius multifiliis TaxID=5932 RepID=G0QT38_ICHMU|nr:hypothetical protein IMG5_105950 [Ichthyophthirius multifiliis]EGR31613.1 hypothetical protein IMG5_105950 [Ichthyophthirius multifiliis]|eukprot:XP_004035099.1 hypothetical protein IMG5_105950 [Ichthyophthirius multifiliis]
MNSYLLCKQQDHFQNPLNIVCFNNKCQNYGLICSYCLIESHADHVKQCIPLYKAINQIKKQGQKLNISNEMINQNKQLINQLQKYILTLKIQINMVENTIQQKLDFLKEKNDLLKIDFFDIFENQNNDQIQEKLIKIIPFYTIKENGEIELIYEELIKKNEENNNKIAEIMQMETIFQVERQIEDLKKLENSLNQISQQEIVEICSQNRFKKINEIWTMKETEAISFQIKIEKYVNLNIYNQIQFKIQDLAQWFWYV